VESVELLARVLPCACMSSKGYSHCSVYQYVSLFVDTEMSGLGELATFVAAFSCYREVTNEKIVTY